MSTPTSEIVELDVGGVHYTTTTRTLGADPDSLLAKLFASQATIATGSDVITPVQHGGRTFIDRDGHLFRFILDYLRNDCRLVLPDNFHERARLRQEADYYRLAGLSRGLQPPQIPSCRRRSPSPGFLYPAAAGSMADGGGGGNVSPGGGLSPRSEFADRSIVCGLQPEPGYIVIGYRGTFAFGRDGGVADVKFRKLTRILVSGRVALCKEVFGEALNDSRDPDRGDGDRYSARFFLKHTFLEQAFDALLDNGFRMVGACGSGTNSAGDSKPGMDTEESRWNHYNEFVFTRA